MIPPTSKGFLVKDLAAGREYHLCVLAIYNDGVTSLTVTQSLGCLRFSTLRDGLQCHALHTQFLGGTVILVVGGLIVASVLVFIVILMIRYKAHNGQEEPRKARVSNVYSQTNGGHPVPPAGLPGSASRPEGWEGDSSRARRDRSVVLLSKDGEKGPRPVASAKGEAEEEEEEEVAAASPRRRRRSRTNLDPHRGRSGFGPEAPRAEGEPPLAPSAEERTNTSGWAGVKI